MLTPESLNDYEKKVAVHLDGKRWNGKAKRLPDGSWIAAVERESWIGIVKLENGNYDGVHRVRDSAAVYKYWKGQVRSEHWEKLIVCFESGQMGQVFDRWG